MMQWSKKTGLCLVLCCLLVALLTLGVCAADGWSASADAETITDGEKVWEWYWLPDNVVCVPSSYYALSDEWLRAEDENLSLGRPYGLSADGGDIVWTGSHTNVYVNGIYVTPAATSKLNMWRNGISENYRLRNRSTGYYAYYDDALVEEMAWLRPNRTMDVRELKDLPCYEVMIFDSTDTFGYPSGAIYEIDGALYYICYADLDNTFFDSEGNFSYRRGTVRLAMLNQTQTTLTRGAIYNMAYFSSKLLEADEEPEPELPTTAFDDLSGFWVTYCLLFLIAPAPIIILGVVFAGSKKMGYPTYYYGLAAAAGGWLLVGAVLAVLLLI